MLLLRPYGHRANPEFADLSSRSLRNADGRCHRRIEQLYGGVDEAREGRTRVCLAIMPELARLPTAITCLPIPSHLSLITVSTSFF